MFLYSTNNKHKLVTLKEAVLRGLPEDNGLYMPVEIPPLPDQFFRDLSELSFQEASFMIAENLIGNYIPKEILKQIVFESINFPAPVHKLSDSVGVLELFHGPTFAFKDFGARFMARLMSYFTADSEQELIILVATSGDTGGAVAAGFSGIPGIRVVILYPSGKVSPLQEKQLTTHQSNITALEVDGTFDDCQKLVKMAFLDSELTGRMELSSANSINIARLIPQSFYYFEAYKQMAAWEEELNFIVPSGNFGNVTAGLFAWKMGLPVKTFMAATNINKVFPDYLVSGKYEPKVSLRTISNAMDVGNPSNFVRILDLFGSTWNNIKDKMKSEFFTDEATQKAILEVYTTYNYLLDPHGAIGYLASLCMDDNVNKVLLATASPAKFSEVIEPVIKDKVPIPEELSLLADIEKKAVFMNTEYENFKSFLIDNF